MAASVRKGMPGIPQACRIVDQQPRGFDLRRHLCQFELHTLEFADGLAELLALPGIGHGVFERARARPIICAPIAIRPSFNVSMAIL